MTIKTINIICDQIWQKLACTHTMARLTFTTTRFLHQWTNNPCVYYCQWFHGLLFLGLFLRPVWHAQVHGWSSNCTGVTGQAPTPAGNHHTTGPSNCLLFVISRAQWVSGETIWQCSTSTHGKCHHFVAPHHPRPPPLCDHLWYWYENYLKWWAIFS